MVGLFFRRFAFATSFKLCNSGVELGLSALISFNLRLHLIDMILQLVALIRHVCQLVFCVYRPLALHSDIVFGFVKLFAQLRHLVLKILIF